MLLSLFAMFRSSLAGMATGGAAGTAGSNAKTGNDSFRTSLVEYSQTGVASQDYYDYHYGTTSMENYNQNYGETSVEDYNQNYTKTSVKDYELNYGWTPVNYGTSETAGAPDETTSTEKTESRDKQTPSIETLAAQKLSATQYTNLHRLTEILQVGFDQNADFVGELYKIRGDDGLPYGVKVVGYVDFDGHLEYLSDQETALCKYKQELIRNLENEFGEGFGRTLMPTQAATLDYFTDDWSFSGGKNK